MPGDYEPTMCRTLPPELAHFICRFRSCMGRFAFRASEFNVYREHLYRHYPMAFFCPSCRTLFGTPQLLIEHLVTMAAQGVGSECVLLDSRYAAGLEANPNFVPRWFVRRMNIFNYCNLYRRGVMDDYALRTGMPEEHFLILSGGRSLRRMPPRAMLPNNNVYPQN